MKIAIAGAGAMGGRFGYMLSKAGQDVILIDQWDVHIAAIREHGLQVNDGDVIETVQLPIYRPEELVANPVDIDLVILFTKSLQLEGMLQAIQPLIQAQTSVLCLLNGIGHETTIEKYVSKENIFLGCTMWTAGLEGPGKVKLPGGVNGYVVLQNLHSESKQTALRIAEVLSTAGLHARYSDHVLYEIYKKACANGATNAVCTLLEANLSTFGETTCAETIVRTTVGEYVAVAEAEGVDLDIDAMTDFVKTAFDPAGIGGHYPSTYQDLILMNRRTEVDCINGIIAVKGEAYGISTPYCAFVTELIHCKEEILGAI
ncbi:MAG: 2-dehydropantoate 2-reductase [Oscillospiraceae bacterium]|nr:2-dehydropantoate 2-reductase [Oscillospiraceae bacterium]